MSRSVHEQLFLGIDGGASNTTVAILNQQHQVVYQHTYPLGANHHALGIEQAITNLEQVIQQSTEALKIPPPLVFDRAVFGLSGCNFPDDQQALQKAIKYSPISTSIGQGFDIVNDSQIALRAGLDDQVGLALIVGTGSNCFGRNEKGQQIQVGGWDYILADQGSGYDIGLRTLKAVTSELDGRADQTRLTKELFSHLNVTNLQQFHQAVYKKYTTKAAIASLAPIAAEVAETSDHVAQHILNHSVNELLKMIDAVMTKLEWRDRPVSIVLVGSLIHNSTYLYRRLQTELLRINPQAKLLKPTINPAVAAALMATESRVGDPQ